MIPLHNFGELKKISWGRASRTDKGVHASLNVVKCNLEFSDEFLKSGCKDEDNQQTLKSKFKENLDLKKAVRTINQYLPEDIKVFSIKLVTKNFVCKTSATSRKYEYILPISVLKNETNK